MGQITTFIPYDLEGDLGRAYNKCMSHLYDHDWGAFLDHDAMFLQPDWLPILDRAIKETDFSFFTCYTNRIGNPQQILPGTDKGNHDIRHHRKVASLLQTEEVDVTDITSNRPLSGVFMAIRKSLWTEIGGATSGFLGVDNKLHYDTRKTAHKIGRINNLYVYHWYRGP